jgi:hypothetical protein
MLIVHLRTYAYSTVLEENSGGANISLSYTTELLSGLEKDFGSNASETHFEDFSLLGCEAV